MRHAAQQAGRSLAALLVSLACVAGPAAARPALPNKEFNDLKKEALKAAQRGDMSELASKLRELGRDDSDRAIEAIASIAVRLPDMQIYNAARDVIAGMRSDEATAGLVALVSKDKNPMVRILLVDALAQRDDEASAGGIAAAIGDRTEEVARAAIQAARKRKLTAAVDALIDVVAKLEAKDDGSLLITLAREALNEITGEAFAKAADWRNFWEPRKATFRPVTGGQKKDLAGTSERKRPVFFGSEIKSNRVVFVIDASGSMEAADPGTASSSEAAGASRVRMERAKQQLAQVVAALPDDVRFTIVSYSGILYQGGAGGAGTLPPGTPQDGPLPPTIGGFEWLKVFKPRLTPANARTKAEAAEWISQLKANGTTFTLQAIRAALEIDGADTIVLLSDGMPTEIDRKTGEGLTPEKVLEEVTALNRFRRMRIDTFGFDPASGGAVNAGGSRGGRRGGGFASLGQFMQDLAEQNGGGYTQIP